MLTKNVSVDKIEVSSDGSVCVRSIVAVLDDGKVVATNLHRHIVFPGDDYSGEDARVQAVCAATHTPEVVEAYKSAFAAKGV